MQETKPYRITKRAVLTAYERVKEKKNVWN